MNCFPAIEILSPGCVSEAYRAVCFGMLPVPTQGPQHKDHNTSATAQENDNMQKHESLQNS